MYIICEVELLEYNYDYDTIQISYRISEDIYRRVVCSVYYPSLVNMCRNHNITDTYKLYEAGYITKLQYEEIKLGGI